MELFLAPVIRISFDLGFVMIPIRLLQDATITASQLKVMAALMKFCHAGRQYCFPKIETIARVTSMSRRQTVRVLHALCDRRLINISYQHNRPNIYWLKIDWESLEEKKAAKAIRDLFPKPNLRSNNIAS